MSEQPTIDINKIVSKYQAIIADVQLQNILLNIRVEELQQQISVSMAAQALSQEPTVKSAPMRFETEEVELNQSRHM